MESWRVSSGFCSSEKDDKEKHMFDVSEIDANMAEILEDV
jgi:hypothetical protein